VLSLESLVVVGLIALLVGVGVGILIGRNWMMPEKHREIEQSLAEAQRELETYQHNVTQHFADTAQKVRDLTQSYKELHEHLALGAMQLTNTEVGRQLFAAGDNDARELSAPVVEPPRDWAPKVPGRYGMLSEEFGLKDEDDAYLLGDSSPALRRGN
jgi:uncharacterized protein